MRHLGVIFTLFDDAGFGRRRSHESMHFRSVVLVCVLVAGLSFREPSVVAQQTQAPGRTMLEMTFPEFEDAVKKAGLADDPLPTFGPRVGLG